MDLSAKKPVPKADDVKIIGLDTQLTPGTVSGQLQIVFYGLGDDGKVYVLQQDKLTWAEF